VSDPESPCILDLLKENFELRIGHERQIVDEREKRYMTMFENSEKNVVTALESINGRLKLFNESRGTIDNLVKTNPTRIEMKSEFDNVNKELKQIGARLDRGEGSGAGKNAIWSYLVGGLGLLALILTLVNALVKK
jgi:hypothetical protein